jgi:hypothetical protein
MKTNERNFAKAIATYRPDVQKTLKEMRKLVLDTARATPGVGEVEESLRWGQHSFVTSETGSGSTIRIDALKSDPSKYAMYFHCQSGLVKQFRNLYVTDLVFDKNRAIIFSAGKNLPNQVLVHCIGLALTHHLRKMMPDKSKDGHESTNHHRHRSGPGRRRRNLVGTGLT